MITRRMAPGWRILSGLVLAAFAGVVRGQSATEFKIPYASTEPEGIAAGPDGNLWFGDYLGGGIVRMTPAGIFTKFPTSPFGAMDVTSGPDGNLWSTELLYNKVVRTTPAGVVTEFTLPCVDPPLCVSSSGPVGIVPGPDGNFWIAEAAGKIGRVTPAGVAMNFNVPSSGGHPVGIAVGSDGNLWFTENFANRIGRITTSGAVTEFPIQTVNSAPSGITSGPDGNLWFTEQNGNNIGRITTSGAITEFPIPSAGALASAIATGPDGNLWFTEYANKIGRITPAGQIAEYPLPAFPNGAGAFGNGIVVDPGGDLWLTRAGADESRITRFTPPASFPTALAVDPAGNGVLEPGESVAVQPSWRNATASAAALTGTVTSFTGPPGATYGVPDSSANYGTIPANSTASCTNGSDCYVVSLSPAGTRPSLHWDATLHESVSSGAAKAWTVHVGESFADVPPSMGAYRFVETLLHKGVTAGCGGVNYCPAANVTRAQMAVFLLVSKEGSSYAPPACVTPVFGDVPCSSGFAPWINELAHRNVTTGCGGGNFCPTANVTRAQMSVFLLKTALGPSYVPPPCTVPAFADVPCSSGFAPWVDALAARGITTGCGGGNYCPSSPNARDQMAVFLTTTFALSLYGP